VGEILTGVAHSASHYLLPIAVMGIELFVAVVQAYIFAMLTNIYISLLSEDHDHHEDGHEASHASHAEAQASSLAVA
jgi:hypothetical protein